MTRIAVASNSAWNLAHFRAPLLDFLQRNDVSLMALVPQGDDTEFLEDIGIHVETVRIDRSGVSPFRDALLISDYVRALRRFRPEAVLGFTAKPNIYGSIAARIVGIPTINNISGLGTGFMQDGALQRIMTGLYRLSLSHSSAVFFQNEDDLNLFVTRKLVRRVQAQLLPGSGIDLARFDASPLPDAADGVHFLLVARMLRDKGVVEFVDVARRLRADGAKARFTLFGPADDDNRSALPARQLQDWLAEGVIEWLGAQADVRPAMRGADVIVLPSYREGMPRTLIEAAALGRPVIATDVPGCRQAVRDGETGWLCEARSVDSLAAAVTRALAEGTAGRAVMGAANRHRAELEFSDRLVVDAYRDALAACGIDLPR